MTVEATAVDTTDEDAAFDAGFDAPATQTETPAEPEAQTPAAETPTPTPEPKYVQITEEDWAATRQRLESVDTLRQELEQRTSKAFGQYGSLKQAVDALGKRGPVEFSADDFAELKEEYGTEIAEKLVLGFKRASERAAPKVVEQPQNVLPAIDEKLAKVQEDLINSRLDEVVDGDWTAEVRTPAFKEWMQKQPGDVQSLAASDNVRDAARLLRLWKTNKTTPPPAAPPAQSKPPARQRLMAAAVNPRGAGAKAPASNEPDPFDEGFNT